MVGVARCRMEASVILSLYGKCGAITVESLARRLSQLTFDVRLGVTVWIDCLSTSIPRAYSHNEERCCRSRGPISANVPPIQPEVRRKRCDTEGWCTVSDRANHQEKVPYTFVHVPRQLFLTESLIHAINLGKHT